MTEQNELHIEDVEEAVRACRPVRPYGPWRIRIGDEHLDFRPAVLDDPVPTGLQFLELAGVRPPEEYMIFQLLRDGTLEELRATETVDLRNGGVERLLVFKGSASYRLELDGRVIEWGKPVISGLVLKKLAGVDPPPTAFGSRYAVVTTARSATASWSTFPARDSSASSRASCRRPRAEP